MIKRNFIKLASILISVTLVVGCMEARAVEAPNSTIAIESTEKADEVTTEKRVTTVTSKVTTTTTTRITTTTSMLTTVTTVCEPIEVITQPVIEVTAANVVTPIEATETTILNENTTETTHTTIETETSTIEATTTTTKKPNYVYKPSTKYIHKGTCSWVDSNCYEIYLSDNTFSEQSESRICSDCFSTEELSAFKVLNEYETTNNTSNYSYAVSLDGTYYPSTAYSSNPYGVNGGSGRSLIGYNYGEIRGSIASSYLYSAYGYYRNGRTKVYIEVPAYPEMNGIYYLDDCSGANVVDFFVYYSTDCPFYQAGRATVNCYIEN